MTSFSPEKSEDASEERVVSTFKAEARINEHETGSVALL
jgi:hypothetical protein